MKISFLSFVLLFLSLSMNAAAAELGAFCTLSTAKDAEVQGTNIFQRLPIASVSKVATTWFGIAKKGLDYRFATKFNVTPVSEGLYDIHITGSRDPLFGRESLHFAISELNRAGITNVRQLSFDENFKFYVDVTSSGTAAHHYETYSPRPATVLWNLQSMGSLTSGWSRTQEIAGARHVTLEKNPKFTVEKIIHVPVVDGLNFPTTKTYVMRSAPLQDLVKEMNRNSNNHAANQIFEHMGGAAEFQKFVLEKLSLTEAEILFLNGSGDRLHVEEEPGRYNEASCASMLKILKSLRETLQQSGKDLEQVMAVVGKDMSSTASANYTSDLTSGAVVAKTGTVDPSITLAGIVSSKKGEYYFMYNMKTNATSADWSRARSMIRTQLQEFIRSLDGPASLNYKGSVRFVSFDGKSWEIPAPEYAQGMP